MPLAWREREALNRSAYSLWYSLGRLINATSGPQWWREHGDCITRIGFLRASNGTPVGG